MPERETLAGRDPCELAAMWQVDERTMKRVVIAADLFLMQTRSPVWIISGYRTRQEQAFLQRGGRPAAPDGVSTHRSCPASGVDISLGTLPSLGHKLLWGTLIRIQGMRWGGGSKVDDEGVPLDWQHADLGPRQ